MNELGLRRLLTNDLRRRPPPGPWATRSLRQTDDRPSPASVSTDNCWDVFVRVWRPPTSLSRFPVRQKPDGRRVGFDPTFDQEPAVGSDVVLLAVTGKVAATADDASREKRHGDARLNRLARDDNLGRCQPGVRRQEKQFLAVSTPPRMNAARCRDCRLRPDLGMDARRSRTGPIRSTGTRSTAHRVRIVPTVHWNRCADDRGFLSPTSWKHPEIGTSLVVDLKVQQEAAVPRPVGEYLPWRKKQLASAVAVRRSLVNTVRCRVRIRDSRAVR